MFEQLAANKIHDIERIKFRRSCAKRCRKADAGRCGKMKCTFTGPARPSAWIAHKAYIDFSIHVAPFFRGAQFRQKFIKVSRVFRRELEPR